MQRFFPKNLLPLMVILFLYLCGSYPPAAARQQQYYFFTYQIDSILLADSTPYRYQTAAVYYTFAGNYHKALEMRAREYPQAKTSAPTEQEKELFAQYTATGARKAIVAAASKTRILILNETHHVPLHRAYLRSLLQDLYRQGYRYLGMEALAHSDSLLNRRGYPVSGSGYYTQEPNFGVLIREALTEGFTLFPYEQVFSDSLQKMLGREKAQATNIKKFMDQHPNGKFILYCGYDHAVEDSLPNFMGVPMAAWIKRMTGIDPFTIDQTRMTESVKLGSRYRQLVSSETDCLFRDSSGTFFNAASAPKAIDCNVYHPDTRLVKGRPAWMISKGRKLKDLRSKISISYPVLVKVYLVSDRDEEAIPLDIVELQDSSDTRPLILMRRHKHKVICINPKGERQVLTL